MVASPEIVAGLKANSLLSVEMKGLLAALSSREGDSARQLYSYGTLVRPDSNVSDIIGNRTWLGDLTGFPPWPGAYIPNDPQGRTTSAAGGWQFLRATYAMVVTMTGLSYFDLPSQIINAAQLANHDFRARSGLDLLATLQAGDLVKVSENLIATWPGGAAPDLPTRYAANLALFTQSPTSPTLPPIIPSPPTVNYITLVVGGDSHLVELEGIDQSGGIIPLATNGIITIDDPRVCSVAIANDLQGLWITPLTIGDVKIHYTIGSASLEAPIEVNVAPPSLRAIRVKSL